MRNIAEEKSEKNKIQCHEIRHFDSKRRFVKLRLNPIIAQKDDAGALHMVMMWHFGASSQITC